MESLRVFLLGLFLTAAAYAQQADPYTWDFGKAQEGVKLEHVFEIVNDTGVAMAIREVTASCGCTATEVTKKGLAPGESTQVKVTFDSTKYSGFIEQFVYVNTDSQTKPVIRLMVKAHITP